MVQPQHCSLIGWNSTKHLFIIFLVLKSLLLAWSQTFAIKCCPGGLLWHSVYLTEDSSCWVTLEEWIYSGMMSEIPFLRAPAASMPHRLSKNQGNLRSLLTECKVSLEKQHCVNMKQQKWQTDVWYSLVKVEKEWSIGREGKVLYMKLLDLFVLECLSD